MREPPMIEASGQRPVAATALGPVRGVRRNGALCFLGVRYGAPTGGGNRFLPPQDPAPWTEPRDASATAASAPQLRTSENTDPFYSWYSALGAIDEDCLFLNVYTPALDDRRRPVMVWIHGGGWREFSGNAPGFDASRLARQEDVVVVSINHRLGAFGFLALDDDEDVFADSANAGLLDIVHALRWVAREAAAFGGDPGSVTVFGESGGASKTVALASMPAARGLFHRAIVQSSGGGLEVATAAEAAEHARRFKAAAGREGLRGRELQALSTEEMLAAFGKAPGAFRGTIDGRNLFAHPLLPMPDGPSACAGIPMLVGTTATEASYYFKNRPDILDIDGEIARRRLAAFMCLPRNEADPIVDAFAAADPALSPGQLLMRVTTDYMFTRINIELAKRQAASAPGKVYLYSFEYPSPIEGGRWGAPHTSELPYIFGTIDAAVATVGRAAGHAEMSRTMMRTWAAFARTGDPNTALVPSWRPFTAVEPNVMRLDAACRADVLAADGPLRAFDPLPYAGYQNARGLLLDG
jgi:para-nitrobenzyl esterase